MENIEEKKIIVNFNDKFFSNERKVEKEESFSELLFLDIVFFEDEERDWDKKCKFSKNMKIIIGYFFLLINIIKFYL